MPAWGGVDVDSHTPKEFGPCYDDCCIAYDVSGRGYSNEYPEGQFVALDTPHQTASHLIHHHDEFEASCIDTAQDVLIIACSSTHKHSRIEFEVINVVSRQCASSVISSIHPSFGSRRTTTALDGPRERSGSAPWDMILWGDVTSLAARRPGRMRASRAWEQRSSTTHPLAGRPQRTVGGPGAYHRRAQIALVTDRNVECGPDTVSF